MRSRYFIESEARLKTLKFTKVPPAVVDRIRFFQLRHSCVLKKDKKGELYVNRAALRAFYAQNKKRKLPITYELRWELACEQGWKCKMCKKKLKVGSFLSLFSSFSSQKEKIKFNTKKGHCSGGSRQAFGSGWGRRRPQSPGASSSSSICVNVYLMCHPRYCAVIATPKRPVARPSKSTLPRISSIFFPRAHELVLF